MLMVRAGDNPVVLSGGDGLSLYALDDHPRVTWRPEARDRKLVVR